jgi:wyosine [tRNA(Phe)-imidazoG37] synthetase (radical SAM superfamily)
MSSHIFGPVPSRRLGRSLGVDLVPFKTCTYDCIYCQLGRTTNKTLEILEWIPLDEILNEIEGKLASCPDYITLSGSGEPTLFSRTGELIDRIKTMTDVPVAVLTNGSLLWKEEIRSRLMNADLIIPSLDAGDEEIYLAVNRPHEDISFEEMLTGLIELHREFSGQYWLEVFLLDGYTSNDSDIIKLIECVNLINPNRVQLNTVSRPPAESCAVGISRERMAELASMFDPTGEVIADFQDIHEGPEFSAGVADVLEMLRRRPCTIEDIANGLDMHRAEVLKYVTMLENDDHVENMTVSNKKYYRACTLRKVDL